MFVNYRPVEELNISQIEEAFHTLQGDSIDGENTIDKHVLAAALEKYGEHMPASELEACVSSLMGSEKAWYVIQTMVYMNNSCIETSLIDFYDA